MRGNPFRRSSDDEPEPTVEAEPSEPAPEQKFTVIVVEDTVDVRDMLRMTLEAGGFEIVAEAGDGAMGLALIEREQPDLVVLDLAMPETGGLEILPLVHGACAKTRVVVYSAIGATYMTEAALNAGAYAYIQKGVSPRSIIEHLRRVAQSGAQRPVRPFPLVRDYA
ncbi:response regulator [Nocardioides taihuensis]|uniref:Response regulator n=1 Tax=Nocardioides taihuensis TaxID=1835606 RepID=A0ABW0BL74_9ACTN